TSAEAARLSSKSMTTWVSGGICMSRSNLRLGASEGESDALLGKGSGSHGLWRRMVQSRRINRGRRNGWHRRRGDRGEFAEQAVSLQATDGDREHLADGVGRG